MKQHIILCGAALLAAHTAQARPVSYPDGWTVMQMHDENATSLHVHYSPTAFQSIGAYVEKQSDHDTTLSGIKYNRLLKRVNKKGSQANVYLKTFVGNANQGDENAIAGSAALAADWETRRYFVSYEAHAESAESIDSSFHQTGRVGIAPYIGDYGDLHTWLMLQMNHRPDDKDGTLNATPLVRLFKGRNMLEAGVNLDSGQAMLNYIHRF